MKDNKKDSKLARPYFSGIPTDVDVENLIKSFGIPPEGETIPYADIESVIGVLKDTHRFRTVTKAWRGRLERESNVFMISIRGEGLSNSTPRQRLDRCCRKTHSGVKQIIRSGGLAMRNDVSRLDPEGKRTTESLTNFTAMVQTQAATEAKKLKWAEAGTRMRLA